MKRLGFLRDVRDERDQWMASRAGTSLPPGNLLPLLRKVLEQGNTGSCVTNAIATALAIRKVQQGRPWELVSRLFGYYFARRVLGPLGEDLDGNLLDDGCRPRDALKVFRRMGCPPEHIWPFELERLNKMPPWNIRKGGIDLQFGYRRCGSVEAIQTALSHGYAVVAGFQVDSAFLDNDGPDVVDDFDFDSIVGGHMLTFVRDNTDLRTLTVVNSWGSEWRNDGLCELTIKLVRERLTDAWAIV